MLLAKKDLYKIGESMCFLGTHHSQRPKPRAVIFKTYLGGNRALTSNELILPRQFRKVAFAVSTLEEGMVV